MNIKGFTGNHDDIETPNDISVTEKPLKFNKKSTKRVDINVLKSKLQESESKEFKKNITIFSSIVIALGFLGIYFSF